MNFIIFDLEWNNAYNYKLFPKIHEKNIIRLDTDEVAQLLDEVESGAVS